MSSRDDFCVWWRENFATATPQDPSLSEAKRCTWLAWSARDARIAELERAQQWQPIETAPADVPLLLYCPDRGPANEARCECREYRNTRGGTEHAWATHWMPLPEAPKP